MKKNNSRSRFQKQICRIEQKCDRILFMLSVLNKSITKHSETDVTLELLHRNARQMREMCRKESQILSRLLHRNTHE